VAARGCGGGGTTISTQFLFPELLLGTLRAVEDKLVVNVEIGTLTILVRNWQDLFVLDVLRDEGD
jgi:hypothetical protein